MKYTTKHSLKLIIFFLLLFCPLMTRQQVNNIIQHYAPVYTNRNNLDVEKTAQKVAGWSVEFFGDPKLEQDGHYHIQTKVPDFHIELYRDLMSHYRMYYMTCPSEFGKTTITSLMYVLYQNVYFKEPYTVLSGRVDDTTIGFIDQIKFEIEDNKKFISIFGDLKGDPRQDGRSWSDHVIETTINTRIHGIAVGGNVRSRRKGQWRITLAIVDDPEELVDLKSPGILHEHWQWMMRTLEKRLDRVYGKLRLVGTRIGEGCSIEMAMKDTAWKGRTYQALKEDKDGNYTSLWEDRFPVSFLVNEKKEAIRNKRIEGWMFERQNIPPKNLQRNLKGYKFHNLIYERRNDQNVLSTGFPQDEVIPVNVYCAIDPAFSKSKNSDPRAIIVYAMGRVLKANEMYGEPYWLNCIWILEYDYNWMSPELIIDSAFNFHQKYYLQGCIIEAISGGLIYESIMTKRLAGDVFFFNNPMNVQFVKYQPENKADRIYAALEPKVKYGQLLLRNSHLELMEECDLFNTDKIHLVDALEMGLRVSNVRTIEYKNASTERQKLSRKSRKDWMKRFKPIKKRNFGIPTTLKGVGLG